jgi:hypothetical protein
MKTKIILLLTAISLASCSPNIVNTWNIDKYEVVNDKGQNTASQNIGTITFKKKGKGVKDINYNVFQNDYSDKSEFTYELKEDYIVIKGAKGDKKDTALNKTWIIVSDKSKKQVWKSTDGSESVQVLELSR